MKIQTQTPSEILSAQKARLEEEINISRRKLDSDLVYLKENSTSLLFSGLTNIIFPAAITTKEKPDSANLSVSKKEAKPFSSTDILALSKNMLPIVWEIVRPIIISWGIDKAKSLIIGAFSGNKRKK
jgi:hypothetical protein